jgi:hypothetical protein
MEMAFPYHRSYELNEMIVVIILHYLICITSALLLDCLWEKQILEIGC